MPDDELDCDRPEFWTRQAAGDIAMARIRGEGLLVEHHLFHAQQAVEKSLKGVLVARGLLYPRTHNISVLIGRLRESGIEPPDEADFAAEFTVFESVSRYGGRAIPNQFLSRAGCDEVADIAAVVLEWAKREIARAAK